MLIFPKTEHLGIEIAYCMTISHSNGCNVSLIILANHLLLPSCYSFVFLFMGRLTELNIGHSIREITDHGWML